MLFSRCLLDALFLVHSAFFFNKDNIFGTEVLGLEMSNGLQKQKFLLDTTVYDSSLLENRLYLPCTVLSVLISLICC